MGGAGLILRALCRSGGAASLRNVAGMGWEVTAAWTRTAFQSRFFKKPIVSHCSIVELLPPTLQIVLET